MPVRLLAVIAALAAVLVLPAPASAGPNQESSLQDDNLLIYVSRAQLRRTLDVLKSLGVDRVRVSLLWKNVAPAPNSRTRPPGFNATDPAAYPPGAWDRYDLLLYEARDRGIEVNFNVTGPSPLWANRPAPRPDIVDTYEPSPAEFAAFVAAAGQRYSGRWPEGPYVLPQHKVPRVSYWSIWNEPNHSGWLTPQWSADAPSAFARAASLYRELLDAAWAALGATGHKKDTILIGETAPKGLAGKGIKRYIEAMTFVRALYCVDSRNRRLGGAAAARLGCAGTASEFRRAHPALFEATGYGHHPYELIFPPSRKPLRANWVTIANLSRLTRALDSIFRRYGSRRRVPLYLTEYGYQTRPPDPAGVSFARQALYLNQSEYMSWRNRRVRTLGQFLLVDDDIKVPASFQSGLLLRNGRRKPSFAAYRLPVWLPRSRIRRGRALKVWALLRPATNGKPARAEIQYRQRRSRRWRRIKRVTTRDRRNYLVTNVRVRRSGHVRVRFRPPGEKRSITSRAATVTVR